MSPETETTTAPDTDVEAPKGQPVSLPQASDAPAPSAAAAIEAERAANEAATAGAAIETAESTSGGAFADLVLEDDGLPSSEDLRNGLRAVIDPEIGYNIVDLGLVYEVTKNEDHGVHVLMTLTSMGCPLTEVIHQQCSVILGAMPGVESVDVEFTFNPPWATSMIEEYVAEELRAMGMNV